MTCGAVNDDLSREKVYSHTDFNMCIIIIEQN